MRQRKREEERSSKMWMFGGDEEKESDGKKGQRGGRLRGKRGCRGDMAGQRTERRDKGGWRKRAGRREQ